MHKRFSILAAFAGAIVVSVALTGGTAAADRGGGPPLCETNCVTAFATPEPSDAVRDHERTAGKCLVQ